MKQAWLIFSTIMIVIGLLLFFSSKEANKEINVVTFETTLGSITIELFEKDAPITTKNFIDYVESGFYNGTLFHRIMPGFVIQGGGLEQGLSDKDNNASIKNEANNGQKNLKWTLSMARTSDPHSATSQFFINLEKGILIKLLLHSVIPFKAFSTPTVKVLPNNIFWFCFEKSNVELMSSILEEFSTMILN